MAVSQHSTNRQVVIADTLAELVAETGLHAGMYGIVVTGGAVACTRYSILPAGSKSISSPHVVACTGSTSCQLADDYGLGNQPGPHASAHISGGNDVIDSVNITTSGLAPRISTGYGTPGLLITTNGQTASWVTGIGNAYISAGAAIAPSKIAQVWHSTTPSAADHSPSQILAGAYIGLAWDSGASTITISVNQPIAEWHITGGSDVVPNRVDISRGLEILSDGTGGVILETNFAVDTIDRNPFLVVSGDDKAWGIEKTYAFLPGASPSSTTIGPILGSEYYEAGTAKSPTTSMVMCVELVIVGDDGSGHTFERTFKATLNKYGGTWGISQDFVEITGMGVGTCAGSWTGTIITRAGTDNGNIGAQIDYGYSGTIYSTWVAKLRIFGGGKYA